MIFVLLEMIMQQFLNNDFISQNIKLSVMLSVLKGQNCFQV